MPGRAAASYDAVSISPAPRKAIPGPNQATVQDRSRDCREARFRTIGSIAGLVFVWIFAMRVSPSAASRTGRPTGRKFRTMSRTRIRVNPNDLRSLPVGRVDRGVLDATTERDIAVQQREDEEEAARDMARYARRVRKRLGSPSWSSRSASAYRRKPSVTGNRARAVQPARPGLCSRFSTRRPKRLCGHWMRHLRYPPENNSGGSMRSHDRTAAANDTHRCDITH